MQERESVVLGYMKLNKRILLIDPCYSYQPKGLTDGISRRCAQGDWQLTYVAEADYAGQFLPYQLIATFQGFNASAMQDYKIVQHHLAVDGAALGIFDCNRYPLLREGEAFVQSKDVRNDFRARCCNAHTVMNSAGYVDEGALSYTRFGDGRHRAALWMNKHLQAERAVIYLANKVDPKIYGLYQKERY